VIIFFENLAPVCGVEHFGEQISCSTQHHLKKQNEQPKAENKSALIPF